MASSKEEQSDATTVETDITLYGATSFVAKHILRYLMATAKNDESQLRITLGGRSQSKLEVLLSDLQALENGTIIKDIFVASGSDVAGLKKMAKRSRVVLNCAGPFAAYSSHVVGACAEVGTDYVDITGETAWSAEMRQKYGTSAEESGARIVSFCGYDSIPSDIAVFAAVTALKERRGGSVEIEHANIWHLSAGLPNGGTVQTAINMPINLRNDFFKRDGKGSSLRKVPFFVGDSLQLTHPERVRHNPVYEATRNRFAFGEWMNQLPNIDANFCFGISMPMFMAPVNMKVLQASSVALDYGPNFTVRERYLPLGFYWTRIFGIMAFFPLLTLHLWIMGMCSIMFLPVIGQKIADIIAPAGSGVPDFLCERMENSVYATVTAKPEHEDDSSKVDRAYCFLSLKGDAGNQVTAQCVSEAALSLVFNRNKLPSRSKDGFGTPAEMLGEVLVERLRNNEVRPVTLTTTVRKGTPKRELSIYK